MAKAEVLEFKEKELALIEALKAANGVKKSIKELGVAPATMTSLIKKMNDERPITNGDKFAIYSERVEDVCPTCGAKHAYNVYWID